jgi:hypothetical protein
MKSDKPAQQINVLEKMREWDTKRKLETLNKKKGEEQKDNSDSDGGD